MQSAKNEQQENVDAVIEKIQRSRQGWNEQ